MQSYGFILKQPKVFTAFLVHQKTIPHYKHRNLLVHPYHLIIKLKNYKKSLVVSNIQRIFATIIKERKAIWKQKTRKYKFIL